MMIYKLYWLHLVTYVFVANHMFHLNTYHLFRGSRSAVTIEEGAQ